jgi:hypothetical protein
VRATSTLINLCVLGFNVVASTRSGVFDMKFCGQKWNLIRNRERQFPARGERRAPFERCVKGYSLCLSIRIASVTRNRSGMLRFQT